MDLSREASRLLKLVVTRATNETHVLHSITSHRIFSIQHGSTSKQWKGFFAIGAESVLQSVHLEFQFLTLHWLPTFVISQFFGDLPSQSKPKVKIVSPELLDRPPYFFQQGVCHSQLLFIQFASWHRSGPRLRPQTVPVHGRVVLNRRAQLGPAIHRRLLGFDLDVHVICPSSALAMGPVDQVRTISIL